MNLTQNLYACAFCPTSFPGASLLVNHVYMKHEHSKPKKDEGNINSPVQKLEKKDQVQDLSNRQSQDKELKTGYNESNDPTKKWFTCKFCNKKFSKEQNKKVHERIHTGEKPFSCNFCDRKFNQLYAKQVHELIHTSPCT